MPETISSLNTIPPADPLPMSPLPSASGENSDPDGKGWRIARICIWWGVFATCTIGLIQGFGSLSPKSIFALAVLGAAAATTAIFEHWWNRGNSSQMTVWKTIVFLLPILGGMAFLAYEAWPSAQITKFRPLIVWKNPAPVNAGTELSDVQLNAKAFDSEGKEIQGSRTYNPTYGTPAETTTTLSVHFSPDDKEKYTDEDSTVTLVVIPSKKQAPSISLEDYDAFAFQIQFLISNMGDSGIYLLYPPRADSAKGLAQLSGIARFPSGFDHPPSPADMLSFLSKILEYYIYREIFVIQDPNPAPYFSYDSKVGQSTHIEPIINVPDAREYPKSAWLSQIDSLGLYYNQHFGGPDDFSLPTVLRLPAGVKVKIITAPNNAGFTLKYERLPDLNLDFNVKFPALSTNAMPPVGLFPKQSRTLDDVGVTVQSDFHWHGDPSQGEEYRDWGKDIVSGLKSRLAVSQSKQP